MPSKATVGKAVSKEQLEAFETAVNASGLNRSQALDHALTLFCQEYGVEFPPSQQHGGERARDLSKHSARLLARLAISNFRLDGGNSCVLVKRGFARRLPKQAGELFHRWEITEEGKQWLAQNAKDD